MWQPLLLLLLLVYISLLLIGRLHPRCVPLKLRLLLFIPNSLPDHDSSSSSESIHFNGNSSLVPEILEPSKYDVFISFRGGDVRNNFLSHLYAQLNDRKKLLTYKDDVDLQRGQEISPSLLRAIKVSDVYVVILSPNYADSPWCLEELERILQCKERHGRRVIPVFYGVDPSDVESQKLPSSTAGHIQSWRAALLEIANLSGFDSQVIRPETKLIDEIVKAVFQAIRGSSSQMVKYSSYSASRGLVGVERKIEQVEALLCLGDRSNRTIGLWGMAGIGKTALAKAFFDLFSCEFEASYFFSNFADAIASGLTRQPFGNLQNEFFLKLLGDENGGAGGTLSYDLRLRRLGRIRALVVIDDVGNDVGDIVPLTNLLNGQYSDMFGPGSVIIMTSRNKQLLKSVCHHVYEVKGLEDEEGFQLFCSRAFREESVPTEYREMIEKALRYVGGNPLAIIVLGSHLFGRDLTFWEDELDALQHNPNPVVQSVLRRSFDGLNRPERDVFLDIACFYDHSQIRRPEVMEAMAMSLEGGSRNLISNLVDKSLISIRAVVFYGDLGLIEMNGMLQDLGKSIVNEARQTEKRTRLWKAEHICDLFRGNKGNQLIEGIFLNMGSDRFDIQTNAFVKVDNLRFLVIPNISGPAIVLENELKYLPNTLRILGWPYFPSKCLPFQFSAKNLITLDLDNSEIEQLWDDDELNVVRRKIHVHLGNLHSLNLNGSKKLKKLPDLSTAKRLREIDLNGCESLEELPTSILDLPKLDFLDVSGCMNINWNKLEGYIANRSREQTSDILPNLTTLDLSQTPIQKVPSFITRLHILELFCLNCTELTEFPVIPTLERLTLTGSLIEEVVELEKLSKLKYLHLFNNEQLVLILGDCSKLKSLTSITLQGCRKLSRLPASIGNIINLERLDLSGTAVTELPSSTGDLIRLSELILTCCKSLASLPDTMHKLPRLLSLWMDGCDKLKQLPQLPSSLNYLSADGCKSLQTLSVVEKLFSENTSWLFGHCWKLDPVVCSKLVDQFAKDVVQSRDKSYSSLILPAKWDSESDGEEGRTVGSNNNPIASAKFLGRPWKPKRIVFCALLNPLAKVSKLGQDTQFRIECVMLKNKDRAGAEVIVSYCLLDSFLKYEDYQKEHLSKGHFVVWSTREARFGDTIADEGSTLKFYFRGSYRVYGELTTVPNLIKNCRVIPVYYDSREVTYENEEEVDDQSLNDLRGLYDKWCALP